ncbi:hypothetical protein [Tahibacter sp.]|uniref:hypothetical protein n=1 Tax=Tahibacter sp. TaxID=2056211 RepID=UPI0039C98419
MRTEAHVARGELVALFREWQLEPMPLYLAFPPSRHVSGKLRAFIEWVVALMERRVPVRRGRSVPRRR